MVMPRPCRGLLRGLAGRYYAGLLEAYRMVLLRLLAWARLRIRGRALLAQVRRNLDARRTVARFNEVHGQDIPLRWRFHPIDPPAAGLAVDKARGGRPVPNPFFARSRPPFGTPITDARACHLQGAILRTVLFGRLGVRLTDGQCHVLSGFSTATLACHFYLRFAGLADKRLLAEEDCAKLAGLAQEFADTIEFRRRLLGDRPAMLENFPVVPGGPTPRQLHAFRKQSLQVRYERAIAGLEAWFLIESAGAGMRISISLARDFSRWGRMRGRAAAARRGALEALAAIRREKRSVEAAVEPPLMKEATHAR